MLVVPVSAGLFQWTRLGRLIPQTGFEPTVSVLAGHPTNSSVLYAGTLRSTDNTNLIFRSDDAGATWSPASGGLPAGLPQNTGVNDLIIRPDAPGTMFAGLFEAGVWQSTNGGQNWSNTTNGSIAANDTVRALAIDPAQPTAVYALTGIGAHVSINGGQWQSRSAGLPIPSATLFNDLATDPVESGTLYVGASPQGVYRSTNGGLSWEPANNGLPAGDLNVRGIATSSVSGRLLISIAGQGLWRSDDQGNTWTRSDNGITYNSTLQGNVGIPTFSYADEGFVYVYNNDGVFVSFDGGENWAPFNDGFTGAETVTTMAFHPAAVNTVYAGTSVAGTWSLTVVPSGRFYVPVVIR
jgi:photosystem II stability/assembly factor-like uncharacterized protein